MCHPPNASTRRRRATIRALTIIPGLLAAGLAHADLTCEQAAAEAEQSEHLPPGLLLAIGRVETGRWDRARGQIVPWPWSIDAAGNGRQFAVKDDSVKAAQALLDSGQHNVDVGCFQISLLHHPAAFSDLGHALDPAANASYAARFLGDLHARLGRWEDAVAAYHSADPALGVPYQQRVYARWDMPAETAEPGIHVWTPSPTGAAPGVIVLRASATRLPHVITPSD